MRLSFYERYIRTLALLLALGSLLFLTACPLDFADLDEPQILNMTISPSTITHAETGSTESFSVEISVVNFDDEPDSAEIFIQDGNRSAAFNDDDLHIDGNLILIDNIAYTWFQGYSPGVYDIGVEISSPTVSLLRETNVATVTIEP